MKHWTGKPNPEFEQWWATKIAEGYQYRREALENVRFGFEGAQSTRWQPIETAPKDGTRILLVRENYIWLDDWWKGDGANSNWSVLVAWQQATGKTPEPPTHWMPLPSPPSSTEVNNGR